MPRKITLILLFLSIFAANRAQDDEYAAYTLTVQARMQQFYEDLMRISNRISSASSSSIGDLERNFNSLDIRWNTYYTAQQGYIADNEEMLSIVARYQQMRQMVADSISNTKLRLDAVTIYEENKAFLLSKAPEYDVLIKKCEKLALTKQTAPQLERIQAAEQLSFAKIAASYQKAKEAVALNPTLSVKESELDNIYLDISARSEKVQQIKYQSFLERIKDYLLGIAAVAIVLMFVSMIQNKIVATKQMRESLKKLKEQYIKDGQDDIPSI